MLFAATIFVSAFLLFQVQPLVARMILPWFGGSAAVWTTCMLFFQLLLVGGYLYSHWLVSRRPRTQAIVHIAMLALATVTLPVMPDDSWQPQNGGDPTLRIIALLGVSVGLPYFLLSTTSPLVQSWYSRAKNGAVPYRLFALSNFGSMLALLSYPVLIEPLLPLRAQDIAWSIGFGIFAVSGAALAWVSRTLPPATRAAGRADAPERAPNAGDYLVWILLPACASVLLLAYTSHLSQNVAPIPFLWVLPLALYLASFILCFEGRGWYRRWIYLPLLVAGFAGVASTLAYGWNHPPIKVMVPLYAGTLFVACMACHGELARAQPHPRHLTIYYLMISVGGALGGLFVSLAAPRLFTELYELPIGMVATALAIGFALAHERSHAPDRVARWLPMATAFAAGALGVALWQVYEYRTQDSIARVRNFYAAMRVEEYGTGASRQRTLTHGTITHGKQYLDDAKRRWPTTYYAEDSGVGRSIAARQSAGPVKLGVIGLGVGTLATYGREGDVVRIYEINPQVVDLAREKFFYLADTRAKTEMALGDARLVLDRESAQGSQGFDVLAVDAFSSDSIPVHLLTREAFGIYFRHMKPDGILAVHISNRYLDLEPVVKAAADAYGKVARIYDNDDVDERGVYSSTWVLLAANEAAFAHEKFSVTKPLEPTRKIRAWTDDYSDLYAILKW
jgi:hypothetical protein